MSLFALRTVKSLVAAAVIAAGSLGLAQTASAGHEPCCEYKKVIKIVCKKESYCDYITKYDHCGHPYEVKVIKYRTIHVPVVTWVKVCH